MIRLERSKESRPNEITMNMSIQRINALVAHVEKNHSAELFLNRPHAQKRLQRKIIRSLSRMWTNDEGSKEGRRCARITFVH